MRTNWWPPVLGSGLLAGLTAALVMTLVMAVLREVIGVSPPAELIGDRIAPLLPVRTFLDLLQLAGGYNQLKQIGVGSVILGQLAVGALGGMIYAWIVERERARDPDLRWRIGPSRRGALLVAITGVTWLVFLALLWPVLSTNYRGLPPRIATVVSALGLLLAFLGYVLALRLAYRFMTSREVFRRETPVGQPLGRRALIVAGAGLVFASASGQVIRRLYQRATFSYDGTQYRGPDVQAITPNDRFYVVTKNVIDPNVNKDLWRLEVTGRVDRPHRYRFGELTALPSEMQETTLQCISNQVGDGLNSNAVWTGMPLRRLLEAAGPKADVVEVLVRSVDGYTDTISFEKAMDPSTFVAYEMNGEPLPERHGYPVRMIVPGLVGEKSVKWVTRIELLNHEAKGFYEQQGWGPDFTVQTHARIDTPDAGQVFRLTETPTIDVRGIAFAGDRGIARVEISPDGGQTWQEAKREYTGTRLTWTLWSYEWRPGQVGEHTLVVRATDGRGVLQTANKRSSVPEGATGLHTVKVRVEA